MDDKRITEAWKDFQSFFSPNQRLADLPWFSGLVDMVKRKRRGRVRPVVLEYLKERFPIEKHPDGFPDYAFVPRKALVKDLRTLDPKRLGSLDEWTLDQAIAEYNRLARRPGP
jgi:hypothetical protein